MHLIVICLTGKRFDRRRVLREVVGVEQGVGKSLVSFGVPMVLVTSTSTPRVRSDFSLVSLTDMVLPSSLVS